MNRISETAKTAIDEAGRRHGFSADAARSMMDAIERGGGGMAQFSHPEFGGSGQWMRGGMIMVSDMFKADLKNRIDDLCRDLSDLLGTDAVARGGSFQSQRQGPAEESAAGAYSGEARARADASAAAHDSGDPSASARGTYSASASSSGAWWPSPLGSPDSAGAQNDARYAYFADAHRLAIAHGGAVTVYDTLDHHIDGFSQQQPGRGHATFHSQHGDVDVTTLPIVSGSGTQKTAESPPHRPSSAAGQGAETADRDALADLERLAALNAKGIISDDEFAAKKRELLQRI